MVRCCAQVIHCDLKSSNLLVANDSNPRKTVKICDFSMSRITTKWGQQGGGGSGGNLLAPTHPDATGSGTPGFISPEEMMGVRPSTCARASAETQTRLCWPAGGGDAQVGRVLLRDDPLGAAHLFHALPRRASLPSLPLPALGRIRLTETLLPAAALRSGGDAGGGKAALDRDLHQRPPPGDAGGQSRILWRRPGPLRHPPRCVRTRVCATPTRHLMSVCWQR